jgi:hypothetical protein
MEEINFLEIIKKISESTEDGILTPKLTKKQVAILLVKFMIFLPGGTSVKYKDLLKLHESLNLALSKLKYE